MTVVPTVVPSPKNGPNWAPMGTTEHTVMPIHAHSCPIIGTPARMGTTVRANHPETEEPA